VEEQMNIPRRILASVTLVALVAGCLSCTGSPSESQNKAPTNTAPSAPAASSKPRTTATGKLTANPNPIKVCDKSGSGITTLAWTATGTSAIEVRVGKPDGDLFAKAGPDGTWTTGKWVGDGMTFYLQDVSDGKALTADNTITTLVAKVTTAGCP
jgi:hypothetical protein